MPRICVFDVNETLLDLRALDPHFERTFGEEGSHSPQRTEPLFWARCDACRHTLMCRRD